MKQKTSKKKFQVIPTPQLKKVKGGVEIIIVETDQM